MLDWQVTSVVFMNRFLSRRPGLGIMGNQVCQKSCHVSSASDVCFFFLVPLETILRIRLIYNIKKKSWEKLHCLQPQSLSLRFCWKQITFLNLWSAHPQVSALVPRCGPVSPAGGSCGRVLSSANRGELLMTRPRSGEHPHVGVHDKCLWVWSPGRCVSNSSCDVTASVERWWFNVL